MSCLSPFKWRHFEAEIILPCVNWYMRYPLSYRDFEEMLDAAVVKRFCPKALAASHTTIPHVITVDKTEPFGTDFAAFLAEPGKQERR